ncbi:MAG TPA: hypothetical protein VGD56_22505 [Gemmatirosa sp.]
MRDRHAPTPQNTSVNKQQVLGIIAAGTLAVPSYVRRIEYVHAYGDVVVVAKSETMAWAGTLPMAGPTSSLRFTALWMACGGRGVERAGGDTPCEHHHRFVVLRSSGSN